MAYTQKHKYGFRDSLGSGDPEKVIYGVYFDDEFEALEVEIQRLSDALDPDGDSSYLTEAPDGAAQPWARDGDAEDWVQTVALTQYNTDISNINDAIDDIVDGTTPLPPSAETDPTVPDHVKAISTTDISNWNASFGWGDHSTEGYLKSGDVDFTGYATEAWVTGQDYATRTWVTGNFQAAGSYLETETDPTVPDHVKGITQANINAWNAASGSGFSGSYNDLTDVPSTFAPSAHGHGWGEITGKPSTFPPTSHGHSYGEITGAPTIPTKTSQLTNDSGYITSASIPAVPTKTSQLTNDSGFITSASVPTKTSQLTNDSGYVTGTVVNGYATETWVNSQGFAKGSFVPTSGNTTISGTLTANDFIATSDAALKMNVETAALGLIDQIRGVTFDWKDGGKTSSGVIANEIEKVLPHLVSTDDEGIKSVSYLGLIAYLIEEIKALKGAR